MTTDAAPGTDLPRPIVLFADDDRVARAIAREVVTSLGFSIVLAEDGEKALRLALELKPELLITDALMPRLDGRQVAKQTKEASPDTHVVVITSVYKDPRYKYEAYKSFEVDEYLLKPITADKLRDVVVKHLQRPEA